MSKGAIVIVGATGGIGSAIVRRAAKDGYAPLILMDRMGDALNTIASETGGHPIEIDLTIGASVAAAFTEAKRHAGLLYALVLAAGVVDNGKLNDLDVDRWSDVISVNLTGPFLCCLAARDWLVEGGRIVTLGSLAGRTGGVATGTAYAAQARQIRCARKCRPSAASEPFGARECRPDAASEPLGARKCRPGSASEPLGARKCRPSARSDPPGARNRHRSGS